MRKRGPKKKIWLPEATWFWERVIKTKNKVVHVPGHCWEWGRFQSTEGYGMVRPPTGQERKTHASVSYAATGKTWKHITDVPPVSATRGVSRDDQGRFS